MTDNRKIEDVARGLTEAQRLVLESAENTVDGRVLVPSMLVDLNQPEKWPADLATYYSLYLRRLTPLGIAVANHIKGTQNDA